MTPLLKQFNLKLFFTRVSGQTYGSSLDSSGSDGKQTWSACIWSRLNSTVTIQICIASVYLLAFPEPICEMVSNIRSATEPDMVPAAKLALAILLSN